MSKVRVSWTKHVPQNFKETLHTFSKCNKEETFTRWTTTTMITSLWNIWKGLPNEFRVCAIPWTDEPCPLDVAPSIEVSKCFTAIASSSDHVFKHWLRYSLQYSVVKLEKLNKSKCSTFRTNLSLHCW